MAESRCYTCHEVTPIDDLDAKPSPTLWLWLLALTIGQKRMLRYAADHGYDFDHLECPACYGPGYVKGDAFNG